MRDALVNLGFMSTPPYAHDYVLGDLDISRRQINNGKGYAWRVTFADSATGGTNAGDQVSLTASATKKESDPETNLDVIELTPGARPHGRHEVQIIRTSGSGLSVDPENNSTATVSGYWRVGFDGSAYSNYLPADATPSMVKDALELLDTVRTVSVSSATNGETLGGVDWRVTFTSTSATCPSSSPTARTSRPDGRREHRDRRRRQRRRREHGPEEERHGRRDARELRRGDRLGGRARSPSPT